MLTLTERKHPSNYENAKQLKTHWNKLRAFLRYHDAFLTDFFYVVEYKPIGVRAKFYDILTEEEKLLLFPHMHILIPEYIDVELIRRGWFKVTGYTANSVHLPDDNDPSLKNPASYLMKYITSADFGVGFSKHERRVGFSRNYKAKELAYIYPKKGTYLWGGKFGSYTPYISNKGGIFFPSWLRVSKEDQEKIQDQYDLFVEEYYTLDKNSKEAAARDQYNADESNMFDYREQVLDVLYDKFRDEKFVGEYVVDDLYMGKWHNPAHGYAVAKVGTLLRVLKDKKLLKYFDINKGGTGNRAAAKEAKEALDNE